MKRTAITHAFVECIPETLEDGTVYVSIPYATAVHKCFCGCGSEVVTPLSPTDWQLTFDGRTISLFPSVGSWNLPCRSHYWVRRDWAEWAPQWTKRQVEAEKARDRLAKEQYFRGDHDPAMRTVQSKDEARLTLWGKVRRWMMGK